MSEDTLEFKPNIFLQRITNIVQCTNCKEITNPDELYQCPRGHQICEPCFIQAMVKEPYEDMSTKCLQCQVQIHFGRKSFNLVIRNIIREFDQKCEQCNKLCIRRELGFHMQESCVERPSQCKYRRIGCPWTGTYSQLAEHEQTCKYPQMKGKEIVENICKLNKIEYRKYRRSKKIYKSLSSERIFSADISLISEFLGFTKQIVFLSASLYAFDEEWKVTVRIQDCLDNLKRGGIQNIRYCLDRMSTNKLFPLKILFYITSSPKEQRKVIPCVQKQIFDLMHYTSGYRTLDINDSKQRNMLLVQKEIWLRIFMFYKLHQRN